MIIGCDEAGKGPVIGSMFVSCVKTDDISLDVSDSKKLTNSEIHRLAEKIQDQTEYKVREITPTTIDNNNLNELLQQTYVNLITELYDQSVETIYADAFINDTSLIEKSIKENINTMPEIVIEHKADEKYDAVSMAGILSKHRREMHVNEISDEIGDFGSGYPNDQKTRSFLRNAICEEKHIPKYVRKSWNTVEKIKKSC